jgi:hypothetical protein
MRCCNRLGGHDTMSPTAFEFDFFLSRRGTIAGDGFGVKCGTTTRPRRQPSGRVTETTG